MAGLNKVMLIGRIGKDPEVISFDNGTKKATFPLATTDHYRDRENNWQEQTEWHNIVVWGTLANDIAERKRNYIKGDLLYVEGKIRTRQYKDSHDITKYVTEINAERLNMIMRSGQNIGHGEATPPTGIANKLPNDPVTGLPAQEDDNFPF